MRGKLCMRQSLPKERLEMLARSRAHPNARTLASLVQAVDAGVRKLDVRSAMSGGTGIGFGTEARMRYKVALLQTEEGFSVSVPGLPGCWSQGETEQEALENIEDAIREYVAVVSEQLENREIREVEVAV